MCVYLFHELPETARRNAAFEFARVLKPGGIVVLADSLQLGDRPAKDKARANGTFGDFNGNLSSFHGTCDLRSCARLCRTSPAPQTKCPLPVEPFYRNYIATDLGALFEEAGLVCDQKLLSSSTKASLPW